MNVTDRGDALRRLARILEELAGVLHELAGHETGSTALGAGQVDPGPGGDPTVRSEPGPGSRPGGADGPDPLELLEARGVRVEHTADPTVGGEGLVTLARFIGSKHATVSRFLLELKRARSSGRPVRLDLRDATQEELADITLLANHAYRAGLLPRYEYRRSPRRLLLCEPPVSPVAINFFNGTWLELFALQTVRELAVSTGVSLTPRVGVQVRLPDDDRFELDVVCAQEDRLIWIEAKTTDGFSHQLPKYRGVSELICDSPRHAVLLWTGGRPHHLEATRGSLARMTVCAPETLRGHLLELVRGSDGP